MRQVIVGHGKGATAASEIRPVRPATHTSKHCDTKMNIHAFYRPFQRYFRSRRMRQFVELFHPDETTRIVDVGGYEANWLLIDAKPSVLLVNIEHEDVRKGRFHKVHGDGRALKYGDSSFDIAYSNSVIEHVGSLEEQRAFAREIRRVGRSYYVQTPNKWFPVEPHLITIAIHWLPRLMVRHLVKWLSVWGWVTRPEQEQIDTMLASIRLLSRREMKELFPDATIIEERFLGLPKSLIAVHVNHELR